MSFAAKVEKLMFTVGLTDKTAAPIGAIDARIDKLANNAQKGFRNIGYGAAGIAGAVVLLNRAMAPAIDQQRALNEVASLDVEPKALKQLNAMALQTQAQFGIASSEIIRSAYDIQSGISGLNGNELSKFTKNSAILAKGTKSDAATITNYMGTMYGIFKENAVQMGKSQWVDQLAGQTATAVQIFKTTGSQMSSAFESLGAAGQSALVPMHEQMAVLGLLQATMSGSEAGTKYESFLQNIGRAQDKLGLKFTNSQGRMLPIVDIMQKIQGKFGEINTVAKSDIIQQAFGSDEAVALVKLLVADTASLAKGIDTLGDVSGMEKPIKMAKTMTDSWQQLTGIVNSVHTAFSMALMPVLQPVIDKMTEGGSTLLRWTNMFPHLTSAVATVGMAVVGLIATIAALTVAVGIYRFMAVGWAVIHTVLTGGMWLLSAVVGVVSIAYKFARASMLGFYLLSVTSGGALAALRVIMLSLTTGVWAFTAALLANPITWLVVGVVALGAALVAAVVYWDDIKKAAGVAIEWISAKLTAFTDFIGNLNPMEMLGSSIDWLIDKINLIPGVDIETRFSEPAKTPSANNNQVQTLASAPLATAANQSGYRAYNNVLPLNIDRNANARSPLRAQQNIPAQNNIVPLHLQRQINTSEPKREQLTTTNSITQNRYDIPKGGALSQIKQMNSETNNNGVSMGNVTIKTEQINDAEDLQQQLLLAAM
ncbi:phage tail tape measure protein, TP901 family [Paraglaciecola sp. T6c]|uniref:phage tail tape measure protein n=1 Tax=Pseudoalteromonas atlantica (strain T6c / ATCC BAA-1087) TaxID=3042615 RepID=UPI00005C6E2A|nr:phage tail tape measure protein [Paraglaciecola sp. T6c]ABG39237.1 phage tail tape measure protein, TP901 family [Paraglaciecola sp. T6c]